jgi:hypothetical protein
MKRILITISILLLAGAGCTPSAPTVPPSKVTAPAVGSACGAADSCPSGLSCVKYFGIAGPSGPEFKSCEIPCEGAKSCPAGLTCVSIADGPGQVCR